jgi:ribosome biogenesis SPOUT family RNA methylase Rps3
MSKTNHRDKGDDPPQDRTSVLRQKGFATRRLGPKQMTTDTAARVTRMIVCKRIPMEKIPFVDDPELDFSSQEGNESVTMPFRYVKGVNGQPCLPKVSFFAW